MNFREAIDSLFNGKRIRRKDWKKGRYIVFNFDEKKEDGICYQRGYYNQDGKFYQTLCELELSDGLLKSKDPKESNNLLYSEEDDFEQY